MNQDKRRATLFFQSIIELIEFEQSVGLIGHQVDNIALSITGYFSDHELNLALQDYGASLSNRNIAENGSTYQ
ncbi:MAG TPA: hypothetical protein VNS32_05160 [Flavisolibacter sp.]|nr:hypothetical protein [Flavisolibacter sp.]